MGAGDSKSKAVDDFFKGNGRTTKDKEAAPEKIKMASSMTKQQVREQKVINEKRRKMVKQMLEGSATGNYSLVKLLLENGFNPNDSDDRKQSGNATKPTFYPNITVSTGWTAGHFACYYGHLRVLRLLMQAGLRMDIKDSYGSTLLHAGAMGGQLDVVVYLVRQGCSINAVDDGGRTPYDLSKTKPCESFLYETMDVMGIAPKFESNANANKSSSKAKITPVNVNEVMVDLVVPDDDLRERALIKMRGKLAKNVSSVKDDTENGENLEESLVVSPLTENDEVVERRYRHRDEAVKEGYLFKVLSPHDDPKLCEDGNLDVKSEDDLYETESKYELQRTLTTGESVPVLAVKERRTHFKQMLDQKISLVIQSSCSHSALVKSSSSVSIASSKSDDTKLQRSTISRSSSRRGMFAANDNEDVILDDNGNPLSKVDLIRFREEAKQSKMSGVVPSLQRTKTSIPGTFASLTV